MSPKKTGKTARPARPARRARRSKRDEKEGTRDLIRPVEIRRLYERVDPIIDLGRIWDDLGHRFPAEFRVSYRRPDDLLVCDFVFDNLTRTRSKLFRKNPDRAATLILELPAQHLAEEAFLDATGPDVPETPAENETDPKKKREKFEESSPVKKNEAVSAAEALKALPFARVRMAGPSRLAFLMPENETSLDFTAEAILEACRRWEMRLDINAVPEPEKRPFIENVPHLSDHSEVFNKSWLKSVTGSKQWQTSTRQLVEATASAVNADISRSFAAAAGRIVRQAVDAIGSGTKREVQMSLESAIHSEIDALARSYPALRDPQNRDIALATLALSTTEAIANTGVSQVSIADIDLFPFLPVAFAPHKPSQLVTALELPYRLLLSPVPVSNWWHSMEPVTRNGRTELWHTRLTQTTNGIGVDAETHVRALWSPDYDFSDDDLVLLANTQKPFRMSLDPLDRQMLVKLMSGFTEPDELQNSYLPHAARARRLHLSSLGALIDVEGSWKPLPEGVGLQQWRHLGTLGRDHYVRVVYKGFLAPFGHSASLIKVTERKFEYHDTAARKNRVAVLRQRFFIVVREPLRKYEGEGHDYDGRNFPFKSVEVLTRVTPNLREPKLSKLEDPSKTIEAGAPDRACFWPMLALGKDFIFQLAATDLNDNRTTFAMPLLFVGTEANQKAAVIAEIIKQYDKTTAARRSASFGSKTVCYAPTSDGAPGDPELSTESVKFTVAPVNYTTITKPRFYPEIDSALAGIPAIQRLLSQLGKVVEVEYAENYKKFGFSPTHNKGEIFLRTVVPLDLAFGDECKSDVIGGLATPSMAIQGLSRIMGPVAAQSKPSVEDALKNVYSSNFDPADFFKGAKILGGIDLSELISPALSLAGAEVPKLLHSQRGGKIEAKFDWTTTITQTDSKHCFVHSAGGATLLEMSGVVSSPIAQPTATTFNATATLTNFKVNLFGFIIIWFDKLVFTSKTGSKPDITVDLHPHVSDDEQAITFGGPLEFVNELRNIIPSNGFSDPPGLAVTPSGLAASYSLNIPSVPVGIFALEHLSIGASFLLPFDSKPAEVRFNFCERQRPFSLTVSLLGGGGFFAIGIGSDGVKQIEASLEFGAAISIDLGVASGSVEIKAGVYFRWAVKTVELSGYVRLHGELSVLGLISASLTFNLQLAYLKEGGRSVVWGEASLEVSIDILFVSFSVTVSVRKEFGGSNSDPKFIDLIPDAAIWDDYCGAFALEE